MILAVADYVNAQGPSPPALTMALNCRRWNALPENGSLRNQFVDEIRQMNTCLNVYDTLIAFARAQRVGKPGEFLESDPDANRLIGTVLRLDMERGEHG